MKPLYRRRLHKARFLVGLLVTAAAAQPVLLPHVEQVAPGVYACGFADRYGSANCGWVVAGGHTVLIDLPRGVPVSSFVAEVARISGKPVRSVLLTREKTAEDRTSLEALAAAGVREVPASGEFRYIPYDKVFGHPAGAILVTAKGVLFGGVAVVNGPRAVLPGSDTEQWVSALAELQTLAPRVVVPGYGSWGDGHLLDRQRRLMLELRRQIAYGIAMGKSEDAIAREVLIPASYFTWMPYDTPVAADVAHIYREMTVPVAPYGHAGISRRASEPHALVLIGDRFHEPEHIEQGLRPVFAAARVIPHFTTDVRSLTRENLSRVQLLVVLRDGMLWPEGPSKPYQVWMTPEQENATVDFVHNGGAFLNLHNSMGLYPEGGPYLNLVGGRYIGHGPLERFAVEVADPDHPITRGVTGFWVADEQHTPPFDESKVHLLLRNRSDDGKVAAAGWAYEPGRGRLCHLAPGHTREALEHPMFQKLATNAVEWLLRR
jgi:type 1 glutamine amidotransferase